MAKATIQNLNEQSVNERDGANLSGRLLYFLNPFDGRYEDLSKGNWKLNVTRDFTAGLIVAMVAIPLAMGFAMASGLRPEQGIVGGAIAGLVGALFGGSKYQVYGPTAAFIPVIAGIMATYDLGFLVLASMIAGVILMLMGMARLGRLSRLVPHSIVVGFTMGIAIVIALSQIGEALGLKASLGYGFLDKVTGVIANIGDVNWYAVGLGLLTFVVTKYLLKVSPFIPAPLIALAVSTGLSSTVFAGKGLTLIKDKYGAIPTDFFVFNAPAAIPVDARMLWDLAYFVSAIIFVSAVESLLCSRMADRLAENKGMPFNLYRGDGRADRFLDGRRDGDYDLRGRLFDRQEIRGQAGEECRRTRLLPNWRLITVGAHDETNIPPVFNSADRRNTTFRAAPIQGAKSGALISRE